MEIRILRGRPEPEEVAALTVALLGALRSAASRAEAAAARPGSGADVRRPRWIEAAHPFAPPSWRRGRAPETTGDRHA
jgi:Acyl-CoA carboxylase epsilon subunit